uniref:ubiquitinyl hydrolase 1 n=1 Tax=Glossina brevipalpis TaxID=37001 RepID=A0A1A9WNC7_9MUSC
MSTTRQSCSHLTAEHSTLLDIKQLNVIYKCANCQYSGPNLWICLHQKCLQIGCSEQVNDHSTKHFENSKNHGSHCVHLNLSSQRAWCYLCEREVSLDGATRPAHVGNPPTVRSIHASDDEESSDFEASYGIGTGLVGLQNIANTCYMNSALQALSNIFPMTHYFLNCGDLMDHILEQSQSRCRVGLAKSYQRLICDMWRKRDNTKGYVAPRSILYGIRSVHPMFRGFQQHDTQEFLRCFMDQLHEELKEQISGNTRACSAKSGSPNLNSEGQHEQDEDCTSELSSSSSSESDFITCDSSLSEPPNEDTSSPITTVPNSAHNSTNPPTTYVIARSVISDIFDGKLLSSVQCLTCDRISNREETFQDLSLPIPNRDFLTVLHQANSISVQSLNSIDSTTSSRTNESWLSWLWNLFRSWLWGPSVTLYDCMANFFSADELKGDNMYSCEKCNKLRTGVKYSRVLDLPEVLCIHLKRFRHDLSYSSKISSHVEFPLEAFDLRPYLHKDCKSQVSLYNLVSVICHHGTVGGGHYTCFARNALTDRWYEFDDYNVKEVTADDVRNCQAYVLFYHKHNPQMELLRFEANVLSASFPASQADLRFYISREWLARFNTFSEPGPISNWTILCPHGGVLPSKTDIMSKLAVPLSQQLWDLFQSKFGGGPAINVLFECENCKRTAEALARRQCYEQTVFTRCNEAELDSSAIYAISMSWLRKWQQFARGQTHKEPGPINNTSIVASGNELTQKFSPVRSVRLGSDYAQLNASLWNFLHGIYGGGPEVLLRPALTEQIEIVDEDELEESSGVGTNISDTESNIGHGYVPNPNEMIKLNHEQNVSNEKQQDYVNNLEQKLQERSRVQAKRSERFKKSIKTKTLSNNIRKKGKVKRTDLRHADLFGAKGNYIRKDSENGTHSSKVGQPGTSSAFKIKNVYNNVSDDNPNEIISKLTSSPFPANEVRSSRSLADTIGKQQNDESTVDNSYFNKYGKTKNSIILKKFQMLTDINNGINETDV